MDNSSLRPTLETQSQGSLELSRQTRLTRHRPERRTGHIRVGVAEVRMVKTSYTSKRNWSFTRSRIANVFNREAFQSVCPSPRTPARYLGNVRMLKLGCCADAVTKPAAVLNQQFTERWSLGSGMSCRSPRKMTLPKLWGDPL